MDIGQSPESVTQRTLTDFLTNAINSMRAASDSAQRIVWQNPWGLTPQQVFDVLGTSAGPTTQLWYGLAQLVNGAGITENGQPVQVTGLMPAGTTLTFNVDGTVTVDAGVPDGL